MHKLSLVEWEDITGVSQWQTEAEAQEGKPIICQTVGWILKKNRHTVVIASTRDSKHKVNDTTAIPRRNIKKITLLKEG